MVSTTLQNYNSDDLEQFEGLFRHSKVVGLSDNTDTAITSNTTNITLAQKFTPTTTAATSYTLNFNNAFYNPHSGHNASAGGILSSTGFKIDGYEQEMFLNDDGAGNVRRFHYVSGVITYDNTAQGTIDYGTGAITINSLTISSVSNIRGAASTVIELTTQPASNDIVPVRDQILEIDTANSSITVTADTFVGGSADAGVGYTT